jgi:hypothetical protein
MHPRIRRQLGVEARPEHIALANRDNVPGIVLGVRFRDGRFGLGLVDAVGEGGDDGDGRRQQRLDDGGADKDAVKGMGGSGVGQEGQVEGRDEALNLAAEMVAVDADVEAADERLAALFGGVGLFGEEDEASASAPSRFLEDSRERIRLAFFTLGFKT